MPRTRLNLTDVWTYLGPLETTISGGLFKLVLQECDCEITAWLEAGLYFVELCKKHEGLASGS